jgi:hypothetical protein
MAPHLDPASPPAIRPAASGSIEAMARLLTALGHPATADAVVARWDAWVASGSAALVAVDGGGAVCGLATLHRITVLHRPRVVGRTPAHARTRTRWTNAARRVPARLTRAGAVLAHRRRGPA